MTNYQPNRILFENLENRKMFSAGTFLPSDAAPGFLHTTTQLPVAISGGAGATVGSKAYFLSGYGGLLQIYDTKSSSWESMVVPSLPNEGAIVGTAVGRKVVFAGSRVPYSLSSPDFPKNHSLLTYDTVSGRSKIVRIPSDGQWYRILSVGNHIVIDGANDNTHLLLDYNLSTGRWRQLKPPGGSGINEMVIGKSLLVINSHIETYRFDTNKWTEQNIAPNSLGPRIQYGIATINPIGSGTQYIQYGGGRLFLGLETVAGEWFLGSSSPNTAQNGDLHSIGRKFVFAGGTGSQAPNDTVSVSGFAPETYSLSVARSDVAFAAVGNQAIFAGGDSISTSDQISLPNSTPTIYNNVDIFTDLNSSPILSGNINGKIGSKARVTLYNTGDGPLSGAYMVQLYASTDRTLNGAILVGNITVFSSLATGASATFGVRTIQPKDLPAGTYHLLAAVADGSGHLTPIAAEDSTFRVGPAHTASPAGAQTTKRFAGAFTRATHSANHWT